MVWRRACSTYTVQQQRGLALRGDPTTNVPSPAQFAAAGVVGPFDVNTLRELWLEGILTSLTGGTAPTWQPEWDTFDDDNPPNVLPLWKPAAASSPTNWLAALGLARVRRRALHCGR
ncbi:MAG TPA: hypothetical protein VF916_04915 [Ktedonobacterales bacterium]